MKKLKLYIYINIVLSIIFTFLTLSFHADISLLAFPLSLVFSGVFIFLLYKSIIKEESPVHIDMIRRFIEYEPFVYVAAFILQRAGNNGMPFVLDLIAALVWVAITVLSFMIHHLLNEKKVYGLSPEWEKYHKANPKVKSHGLKRVGIEIAEWIDALVQAAFTIFLINIFLFQLYEIPSESMVPTFLIKDRVVVFKTLAGPKFPLSDVGLPYIEKLNRGDLVVFHNPHYKDDRKSEVKSWVSQLVYMVTLTLVNMNTDENGEQKADPLVKRITGIPGEQLILMDGKLYSRTASSPDWVQVKDDERYAAWNLNTLPSATKAKVQRIPLTQRQADNTLYVEEERRNLDLTEARLECEYIASSFSRLAKGGNAADAKVKSLFSEDDLSFYTLYNSIDDNTVKLLTSDGGSEWFTHFMCDWASTVDDLASYKEDGSITGDSLIGGDLYTDSLFRLNVMSKLCYGRLILRNAEILSAPGNGIERNKDETFMSYYADVQSVFDYLSNINQRNMGLFPASKKDGEPQYIPEDCYFMMGDNRYNSLDMRHSYDASLDPLWQEDGYSVRYYNNVNPQFVEKSKILGKASFRFWPADRIGVPSK